MPPEPEEHPFRLDCLKAGERHSHGYKPGPGTTQRCGCGSRRWKVTAGGILPPLVSCANCGSENRPATQYERGRDNASATG